jgi:hypothetical protein
VADVQYNRVVGLARAIAVGRAKFVNAGSLRVGDALGAKPIAEARAENARDGLVPEETVRAFWAPMAIGDVLECGIADLGAQRHGIQAGGLALGPRSRLMLSKKGVLSLVPAFRCGYRPGR